MRASRPLLIGLLLLIALALGWQQWPAAPDRLVSAATAHTATTPRNTPSATATLPDFLPPEARTTVALIQRGGPYPYRQDGQTFGNREGLLPRQPRGWYREYTVDTPGLHHRGTRRIVTGGDPPRAWYYSDDHYRSFRSFDATGVRP